MNKPDLNAFSDAELAAELTRRSWGALPPNQYRSDMEEEFLQIWERVMPYTMTSLERGYALYKAVEYVIAADIPGDLVECGVWKGGSCMLAAHTLMNRGITDRKIWLYDTFAGMTEPTEEDAIAYTGEKVRGRWESGSFDSWAAGTGEVKDAMESTGYPAEMLTFVEGDILETLKQSIPGEIALLRLDTDWYASTAAELEALYPRLSSGGVLVIDDYGHFSGAKKAVDDYFRGNPLFLSRADYTGRVGIKP